MHPPKHFESPILGSQRELLPSGGGSGFSAPKQRYSRPLLKTVGVLIWRIFLTTSDAVDLNLDMTLFNSHLCQLKTEVQSVCIFSYLQLFL